MRDFLSKLKFGVKHQYGQLVILVLSFSAIPAAGIVFIKTQHAYFQLAYVIALVLGALYIYSAVAKMPFIYFLRISLLIVLISYVGDFLMAIFSAPGWWFGDLLSGAYIAYETKAVRKKFATTQESA